jgi:hypothetical protein
MWLLFGVVGGIGMGLVYLPSIVMVGYYFEEKRAIATGKINGLFCVFNERLIGFRYCYGWYGYWFDCISTFITFFICSIWLAKWFTHLICYSSLLRSLLYINASFKTNPKTSCYIIIQYVSFLKKTHIFFSFVFFNRDDDNVFHGTFNSGYKETKVSQAAVITTTVHTVDQTLPEIKVEEKLKKRSRADSTMSTKSRQSIKAEDAVRP